jgi:hypothetical protein
MANTFEAVLVDTPTPGLTKVPVPKEFNNDPGLCNELKKLLAAVMADWGGDDDPALHLFSSEDGRPAGGTMVYIGYA